MVLGLGTVLPPRPSARQTSGAQMPRVQSNNLLSQAPAALSSVGRAVDTPTARHHPTLQPTCSDQSNVGRSGQPALPQQQPQEATCDSLHGNQQQEEGLQQQGAQQELCGPDPQQQQEQQQQPGAQEELHAQLPQQQQQRQQQQRQQQQQQQQEGPQQPAAGLAPGKPTRGARKGKAVSPPPAVAKETRATRSRRLQRRGGGVAVHESPAASSKRRARTAAAAPTGKPDKAGPKKRGRPSLKASAAATPAAILAANGQGADRAKWSRSGLKSPAQFADVVNRIVLVPGSVFHVKKRGAVYVGHVKKADRRRRVPSVVVQFRDDDSIYWFPVADVQAWMAAMVRKGTWAKYNPGVPPPSPQLDNDVQEEEKESPAQALQSLSASLCSSGAMTATAQKQQKQQPVVSSGRQVGRKRKTPASGGCEGTQLQRCGSELKREGALDIMVHAADLNGSPPDGQ